MNIMKGKKNVQFHSLDWEEEYYYQGSGLITVNK